MFVSHDNYLIVGLRMYIFVLFPWRSNSGDFSLRSFLLHSTTSLRYKYKPLAYYFSGNILKIWDPPRLRQDHHKTLHGEDKHRNELSSRVRRFAYIRAPDFGPPLRSASVSLSSLPLPRLGLQLRAAAATLSPLATGNAGLDVKYDARSNFNYAMQQPWIVATGSFRHIGLIHVIRATLIKPGNAVSLNPPVECKMSLAR